MISKDVSTHIGNYTISQSGKEVKKLIMMQCELLQAESPPLLASSSVDTWNPHNFDVPNHGLTQIPVSIAWFYCRRASAQSPKDWIFYFICYRRQTSDRLS